mgnify:CR=1 FL=1
MAMMTRQIKMLTTALDDAAEAAESDGRGPVVATLVAGDLNAVDSDVTAWLAGCGYTDGWSAIHGNREGVVTHKTHTRMFVACDYVMARAGAGGRITAADALLLPTHLKPGRWPKYADWRVSDHRPVVVEWAVETA